MDVDLLHLQCPVSVIPFSSVSCLWGSSALCTVVFNENVTINSWELELKIKPRLNCNSLVCQ